MRNMARVALENGDNPKIKELAENNIGEVITCALMVRTKVKRG